MNGGGVSDSLLLGDVKRLPENYKLLHRLFEVNCKSATGDCQVLGVTAVDVDCVDEFVSYRTLNLLSNAVARRLSQHRQVAALREQTASEHRSTLTIVVDVDPSNRLLVALLATLKLGLAYVPVESRSTAINRIKYILQVTRLQLSLTNSKLSGQYL